MRGDLPLCPFLPGTVPSGPGVAPGGASGWRVSVRDGERPPTLSVQLVILSRDETTGDDLAALGTRAEIIDSLAVHNTAPETEGDDVLHGPGIRIELPPGEPVTQMLMTIVEEEIAWQVIMRLAKTMQWKLLDPATGREFSP